MMVERVKRGASRMNTSNDWVTTRCNWCSSSVYFNARRGDFCLLQKRQLIPDYTWRTAEEIRRLMVRHIWRVPGNWLKFDTGFTKQEVSICTLTCDWQQTKKSVLKVLLCTKAYLKVHRKKAQHWKGFSSYFLPSGHNWHSFEPYLGTIYRDKQIMMMAWQQHLHPRYLQLATKRLKHFAIHIVLQFIMQTPPRQVEV